MGIRLDLSFRVASCHRNRFGRKVDQCQTSHSSVRSANRRKGNCWCVSHIQLRLNVTFFSEPPYLDTVTVAFRTVPRVDVSIKPLKVFDLKDLSFIHDWLVDTIQDVLTKMMVLPERFVLRLRPQGVTESKLTNRNR